MLKVKLHDSTVRKRLHNYGCLEGFPRQSLFSMNRTWQYGLGLQTASEQTTRHLEQCPLKRPKTKVEIFGHNVKHHV